MKTKRASESWKLGFTDGNNGNEERQPQQADYMAGYKAGCLAFSCWIDANAPLESMTPAGTNDAHIEQFHC